MEFSVLFTLMADWVMVYRDLISNEQSQQDTVLSEEFN